MVTGGTGIRLAAPPALRLRTGETVLLTPLRRLAADRWEVSLKGRVLVARSAAGLVPGRPLRARVEEAGGQVLLNPLRRLLDRAGLPDDGLSGRIVSALLRSGIAPDPRWIGRVRRMLAGRGEAGDRLVRLAAVLLDRNVDPGSPGLERVFALLGEGGGGQRQPRKRHGRDRGREGERDRLGLAARLKEGILQSEQGTGSPLPLLNHLAAGHQHWIFIPYRLSGGGVTLTGSLRILYDPHLREARRLVVDCREEAGPQWAFLLSRSGGKTTLAGFCSDPDLRRRGWGDPPEFSTKLHNIGIEVDDTVHEYRDFDGFSLPEEGPRVQEVDTWR